MSTARIRTVKKAKTDCGKSIERVMAERMLSEHSQMRVLLRRFVEAEFELSETPAAALGFALLAEKAKRLLALMETKGQRAFDEVAASKGGGMSDVAIALARDEGETNEQ